VLRILIHPQREITDDGPLKWVAGLYYFRLNSKYEPFGTFIGQPITRINTLQDRLSNESFAAYAQGIYEILPRTNLTLGLRYTTERRTIVGSITGLTTATGAVPGDAFRRNIPARRIALDHKFADTSWAYISWNRRFKSGGFNSAAWIDPARKFTVRAFVDNLWNEAVRGYAVISNKAAGAYLPPRTYGGSISVRF